MPAKVHAQSRFGCVNDVSATGLTLASFETSYSVKTSFVEDHVGCSIGLSLYDESSEVKVSGVVSVKGTGLVPTIAAVLTLANSAADSLNTNSKGLFSSPVSGAGLIVIGGNIKRANKEFETGDLNAIYKPFITLSSSVTYT